MVNSEKFDRLRRKHYFILVSVVVFILSLDQLTKYWVVSHFALGETIPVIFNFFNLTYLQNPGAAFGILSQADASIRIPLFMAVPVFAIAIVFHVFRTLRGGATRTAFALSLIIAGAIGNLVDRVSAGCVIDFLDFHWNGAFHFPAFNVADSSIFLGVSLLILDLLSSDATSLTEKRSTPHASHSF